MARVSGSIPNLINGVSQQPPQLRLATQATAQENAFSTTVGGLTKRPPTGHLAKLLDTLPHDAKVHFIDRDEIERYVLIITGGTIKVYDFEGNEKTVTVDAGAADYLDVTTPREDIRAVSVADFTFILNRTVAVAMDTDVSPLRPFEALINVQLGNYGRTHRVIVNGTEKANYESPNGSDAATDPPKVDTVYIAKELVTDMVSGGGSSLNTAPWSTVRYQNAIYLKNTTTDFSLAVEDGFNGNSIKLAKDKIQRFTDLPVFGPDGFVVQVTGDSASEFDNFWVRFEKNNVADSAGVWVECPEPGAKIAFDDTTLPHVLIRLDDGTFTFGPAVWNPRTVGNEDLSPPPSFVGLRINDVFFHKNRLGFLADENVIMSRSGDFFNFWRGTMTAVLDDDPIDVATTHTRVSLMEHAVPFEGRLIVSSSHTQFEFTGEGILTPSTAAITPKSNFEIDVRCPPVVAGGFIYFSNSRGDYGAVYEYFKDDVSASYDTNEATAHTPRYIPSNINRLVASSANDMLIASSDGAPGTLFPYKFYWSGQDKLQASWSRWTFPGVEHVYEMAIIGSNLYLLVERSDGKVYLEYLPLAPGDTDPGARYQTFLDRKIAGSSLAAPVYDPIDDTTAYTLPYALSSEEVSNLVCCTREVVDDPVGPGIQVAVTDVSGSVVTVAGDTTTWPLWFGLRYLTTYELSPPLLRQESSGGGSTVVSDGRLQLQYMTFEYANSAFFKVTVEPLGRAQKTYLMNRRAVGASNPLPLETGRFRVPVMSRASTTRVIISSDSFLPCSILSAEWQGQFITRSSRV